MIFLHLSHVIVEHNISISTGMTLNESWGTILANLKVERRICFCYSKVEELK